jgi:hypothetical protein
MEQISRNKALLVALVLGMIVGILLFIFLGLGIYNNSPYGLYKILQRNGDWSPFINTPKTFEEFRELYPTIYLDNVTIIVFCWLIGSFIFIIVAVVFNFFARKTESKKQKIIAGIFYLLGFFSIISAIICFISCKEKKQVET